MWSTGAQASVVLRPSAVSFRRLWRNASSCSCSRTASPALMVCCSSDCRKPRDCRVQKGAPEESGTSVGRALVRPTAVCVTCWTSCGRRGGRPLHLYVVAWLDDRHGDRQSERVTSAVGLLRSRLQGAAPCCHAPSATQEHVRLATCAACGLPFVGRGARRSAPLGRGPG